MSEENTTQETQDSVESTEQDHSADQQQTREEMVSKAELQKVLDEMHKYKKTAKEYEATIKNQEKKKLEEQQEWQKLAELRKQEAEEAIAEAEKLKGSFLTSRKFEALKTAAMANGIRKEALDDLELLDFDDHVVVETTNTGKINILGAEAAVKKLKAQKPHWFGKSTGHVNSDNPEVVSGEGITMKKVMEAQAEARKTGDWAKFKSIQDQYLSQKAAR